MAGSYEMNMTSGPLLGKILTFSFPLMCSGVLQLLFNAADIIVVGRYTGHTALAAVGSTSALINLIVNLFVGLSVGANVLIARSYGAKNMDAVHKGVHTAMLTAVVGGVFLIFVGVAASRPMLSLMGTPDDVIDQATLYLRIYFVGAPSLLVYNFGAAILRAVGDTRRPLYYLSVAGVVNVVLNLFFVIVCHLDVAGVAIATVVSQCISATLVVRCMMREQGAVHLELRELRIWKVRLKQILQVGLPAGFQGMLFSLSNVVIQSSINSFGEIIVAGNSAAANIENFIYASMNAFYQANVSFTSQNYGAGRYDRIRPILLRAQGCVVALGIVLGGAATLFGPQLLQIYSKSPAVISAGMSRVWILFPLYAICGMMDVMVGSLRGLGYSVMPMLVSLMGACVFRLVWIATIFQSPAFHTIQTVYWSYPLSWTVTFLTHLICYFWAMRRLKQHLETNQTLRTN